MSRKAKGLQTTYQVRFYPTAEQARLLMAHCFEYISTVNVLVSAYDADMIEDGVSTKDFRVFAERGEKSGAAGCALRLYTCSLELGRLPILKKPICQWNNQNWQIEQGVLTIPVCLDGKTHQIKIRCAMTHSKDALASCVSKRNAASGSPMSR